MASVFAKRATIYLDPQLHKALRIKSIETAHSISELVNGAVALILAEDAADLAAFKARAHEPLIAFEDALKEQCKPNGLVPQSPGLPRVFVTTLKGLCPVGRNPFRVARWCALYPGLPSLRRRQPRALRRKAVGLKGEWASRSTGRSTGHATGSWW